MPVILIAYNVKLVQNDLVHASLVSAYKNLIPQFSLALKSTLSQSSAPKV